MKRKCPPGKYYCYTDKKCKKIPKGFKVVGRMGYLRRENGFSKDEETKKNGNGSSNGNGNGGNGSGNGNGGSGGNGGGNGMGESIVYEASNPRIPRKPGQPAKSKKHSDLYTDEDPKGTIHGLGFKNVAKARASVSKIRNSSRSHAHKIQAAVAMEQRAREMGKTSEAAVYRKYINSMKKKTKRMNEAVSAAQQAAIAIDMKKKGKKPKSMKEGMYNHTDVGLITNAVVELEDGLKTLKTITYDSVDQLMQGIAKRNDISPTLLHNQFKAKHFTIPDDWAIRYRMNKMKGIEEAKKMTKKQIKKRDEIADAISTREMNKRYGDKNVKYAIATKLAMKEEETDKYNVSEEGLRDWFGKSSGTTKSGRKVRGWVQVGGKYDGKPCARQPGQKSTPKCVSSSKRRSMSKSERDSAARRKRAADPNQPQKSGAAKPTNVSTDPKRKMKENYFNRNKVIEGFNDPADVTGLPDSVGKRNLQGKESEASKKLRKDSNKTRLEMDKNNPKVTSSESVNNIKEAKDKKGKGSGTKDACYHKVKSRYSVWPSAYASGALVKCRKVGAANWGNKTKKEGFSPMQVAALEAAGMIELNEAGKKCWKGYKKAGTQKLFGKTYNRCVKAGDELNHDGESLQEMEKSFKIPGGENKPIPKEARRMRDNQRMGGVRNMAQKGEGQEKETAQKIYDKKRPEPKLSFNVNKQNIQSSYAPVTEGVMALMRKKKEEKKKSKPSVSTYVRQRDAGGEGRKLIKYKKAKKDQETVNFLEPEKVDESKTRLVKNGHTYKVVLTWRGKTYMVQMFVPSVSRPTRQQVEKEVQKIYPDAKLMSFLPRDLEPGEPTVMMGEGKKVERDEYGDPVGGPKISKKDKKKNLAKNEPDEQHNTRMGEEYVAEDDMKGMSVKSGHKRPTKAGAGMTKKGVEAYRRRNPGSKLKTAVTTKPSKLKKGSKAANRRKSYCARSAGQMKKFPKAAKDPNSRLRQARRRWNC